jgi:hypothetical protein
MRLNAILPRRVAFSLPFDLKLPVLKILVQGSPPSCGPFCTVVERLIMAKNKINICGLGGLEQHTINDKEALRIECLSRSCKKRSQIHLSRHHTYRKVVKQRAAASKISLNSFATLQARSRTAFFTLAWERCQMARVGSMIFGRKILTDGSAWFLGSGFSCLPSNSSSSSFSSDSLPSFQDSGVRESTLHYIYR